jgi:glycosyltransferase involved in cell wall biosynthesis
MKISILTPSFNSAKFLDRCIRSVHDQDMPAEHLISDGGSQDGTLDVLRRHSNRLSWWVSEPDNGQADALNKALAHASGEIVGWLNADEYYEPSVFGAVEREFADDPSLDLVYGAINLVLSDGRRIRTSHPARFDYEVCAFNSPIITNCAAFFRRDRLLSCGGFDPSYQFAMDAELYLRYMKGSVRWKRLRRPIANFTLHPASKTSTMQDVMREETIRMRRRQFPALSDAELHAAWKRAKRRLQWSLVCDGLIFEKVWFNTFVRPRYRDYFGDDGPKIPLIGDLVASLIRPSSRNTSELKQ